MKDISKENANKLGVQTLLFQTQEECGELVKAVGKFNRCRGIGQKTETSIEDARANLIEEIADVQICLEQLVYVMGLEEEVEARKDAAFGKVAKRYTEGE